MLKDLCTGTVARKRLRSLHLTARTMVMSRRVDARVLQTKCVMLQLRKMSVISFSRSAVLRTNNARTGVGAFWIATVHP